MKTISKIVLVTVPSSPKTIGKKQQKALPARASFKLPFAKVTAATWPRSRKLQLEHGRDLENHNFAKLKLAIELEKIFSAELELVHAGKIHIKIYAV